MTKEVDVDDRTVTLQIWNIEGQERFRSLRVAFYRGADCYVFVYDVNVAKSFDNLNTWYNDSLNQERLSKPENFPFVVMGNKVDVDGGSYKVIPEKKARDWCS